MPSGNEICQPLIIGSSSGMYLIGTKPFTKIDADLSSIETIGINIIEHKHFFQ